MCTVSKHRLRSQFNTYVAGKRHETQSFFQPAFEGGDLEKFAAVIKYKDATTLYKQKESKLFSHCDPLQELHFCVL